MRLRFLGTKGEIEESPENHKLNASLLIEYKGTRVLLDFGETHSPEVLEDLDLDAIVVTHAHPDHLFGLREAVTDIPVYVSRQTYDYIKRSRHYKGLTNIRIYRDRFTLDNILIHPIFVEHSVKAPMHIFKIIAGKHVLLYAPDVAWIPNRKRVLQDVTVYVGDGSYLDEPTNIRRVDEHLIGHASMKRQLSWCKEAGIDQVIFTHFGKWVIGENMRAIATKLSADYDINVHIARDNRMFTYLERGRPAIYLPEGHAKLITDRKKTLIVKTRAFEKYLGESIYFMDENYIYGILKLTKIHPLPAEAVKSRLRHRHRITDAQWKKWWGSPKKVYVYEFDLVKVFDKPVPHKPPRGIQTFQRNVVLPSAEGVPSAEVTPPKKVWKETKPFEEMTEEEFCEFVDELGDEALIHWHSKTHAWFNRLRKGKRIKFSREQILMMHKVIVAAMTERDIQHWPKDKLDVLTAKMEELLPVAPGHWDEPGEVIYLDELKQLLSKPFFLKKPFIFATGGIVIHGRTEGKADLLISFPRRIPERDQPLEFRLGRAVATNPKWNDRLHFLYDEYSGSFTDHLPLYDLLVVPHAVREVIKMEDLQNFFDYHVKLKEIKDPEALRQARKAKEEDKVRPLQFVLPLKPTIGKLGGQRYTIENLIAIIPEEAYPVAVQKKYDGVWTQLMKDGDKVIIRIIGGFDVTKRLPGTVEEMQKWNIDKVTVVADTEKWIKGENVGRELVAGYLHGKGPIDETGILHNVFDIIYFYDEKMEKHDLNLQIGDLHKEPYDVRLRYLDVLPIKQETIEEPKIKSYFNIAPTYIARNPKELAKQVKLVSAAEASEGAVIKSLASEYRLTGMQYKWWKFKKSLEIHAIILERLPTKTRGVYRYRVGLKIPRGWIAARTKTIKGKTFMDIGKTMNIAKSIPVGTIVSLDVEEVFYYVDVETGKKQLHIYVSSITGTRPEQTLPDSADEVVVEAKRGKFLRKKMEALWYWEKELSEVGILHGKEA